MTRWGSVLVLSGLLLAGCGAPGERAVTVFGGRYARSELFGKIFLFKALELQDAYQSGLAYSRALGRWPQPIRWELEGQVIKHFGDQDHWAVGGLLIARVTTFPWNETVPTTMAVGEGFSYAFSTPALEEMSLEPEGGTSRYLNYLLFEITLGLLPWKGWSVVTRIHHRSGIFGLIDGVEEGANSMVLGLRYEF